MGYSRYKPNHNYFKNIDSEYKAYILGFIYADGSIREQQGRMKQLILTFSQEDSYILEKFKECYNDIPIREFYPKIANDKEWKKMCVLRISSDQICEDLIKLGCFPRKSIIGMNFPEIEKYLIPHFVRGFLDGDGCLYIKSVKNKYIRKTAHLIKNPARSIRYHMKIQFTSTDKQFLIDLAKSINIDKFHIRENLRKSIVYTLSIENRKLVSDTIDLLYKDTTCFMKRKYDKVLELKKIIKSQVETTVSKGLETT